MPERNTEQYLMENLGPKKNPAEVNKNSRADLPGELLARERNLNMKNNNHNNNK
ncbi:hypothetical protein WD019_04745 [Fictibacillus sp. Mic-4]|uniref:hypothetical protein n=1 Tax=Fictibacillus sp. Mic-4 TaxID=3132826 RepID=UPI003CF055A6